MDEVLWKGLDVLTDGQDITGLRKMVLVSFMRRHFQMEEAVTGSDAPSALLAKLPSQALSVVADIAKGKTGIKDAKPGPYPLVVTAAARGECDHFDYEGPSVLIPMVSSTGHGDASLKRIHYQEGQYAVGSILAVVRPLDPGQLSARYLYEYLSAFKDELLVSRMVGTANVSLTVKKLGDVPVPLIPMESQNQIERLMALCDRLEADQADAEAAHAQLVQALLDSLTQATDAADFRASWQRLSEHFHTLFTTDASIDALKQTVLRLAFMGKLVQQLDDSDASSATLETIAAAKAQLPDAGRLRQADGSVPATRADLLFDFPAAWQVARMADLCEPVTSGSTPPSSEMDESEGIPFLKVYNIREQRIDFDYKRQFVAEAFHFAKMKRSALKPNDVVMNIVGPPLGKTAIIPDDYATWNCNQAIVFFRLIPPMSPRFIHLFLCEGSFLEGIDLIGTAGQDNISVTKSRNIVVPVPTAAEQHRIVAKVDELMALCDQLKAQLAEARQQHAQLATVLVEQAVA